MPQKLADIYGVDETAFASAVATDGLDTTAPGSAVAGYISTPGSKGGGNDTSVSNADVKVMGTKGGSSCPKSRGN